MQRVPCVTDARSDPRGLRHVTVMTDVSGSVFAHAWWNKAIRGRRAQVGHGEPVWPSGKALGW